jgi:hypothetical protein
MGWNEEFDSRGGRGLHLARTPFFKLRLFIAAVAVGLVTVAPAASAPAVPDPIGPPDGIEVAFLPTLKWNAVAGADHYVVEIGADSAFNPALFTISTKNTRAVADKTVPNGTYYWRVQAFDSNGNGSPWSAPMTVVKNWAGNPTLITPANGATILYPEDPLVLRWTAVAGAAKYRVLIASDSSLSTLVTEQGDPVEVQATNLAPNLLLPENTYYWAVVPLDAQGNPGDRSPTRSFTWEWPSTTTPSFDDLDDSTELFDPRFSWDPIPGAAHYEVEVNSSSDFATGSKVCCPDQTISTTLTPLEVFANNTYYWRVRALDQAGNAGVWNEGPSFVKTFDNYADLSELSIKHLRVRDGGDSDPDEDGYAGTDLDLGTPGYQTDEPILTWSPVPGAASYEVDVVPVVSGFCNWTASIFSRWTVPTASTSWTPLGSGALAGAPHPVPSGMTVSKDTRGLSPGESYCARVRARSGRVSLSTAVWGDYTYLDDGTGSTFTFTNWPDACTTDCNQDHLPSGNYTLPARDEIISGDAEHGNMPLFTWDPMPGKLGYWVIVAKDPSFTTIVDYAFTRIPAYAVRTGSQPRTYADETTDYYWVVLPSQGSNGSFAPGNVQTSAYANFEKQTTPPQLLGPDNGTVFTGQPTFTWTTSRGARRYHLQVDDEPTFGSPLVDEVRTASTSFTALKTYSSASTLYWRVQAEDENNIGLTWSETRNFQVALPAPTIDPSTLGTSDNLPVVFWSAVPGAISYTLEVEDEQQHAQEFDGFPSTAASWEKITGAGILTLRVRAEFPKSNSLSTTLGPWSAPEAFVHTIHEPQNAAEEVGANRLALSWDAKTGMKQYKVQISARQDFSPYIESKSTDNPSFAPTLSSLTYKDPATLYWRVAAVDADGNVGDFTAVRSLSWPGLTAASTPLKTFSLSTKGYFVKNRYRTVYLYAKDSATLLPVSAATVRLTGCGLLVTKLTGSNGAAKFYKKATKTGTATFRVSKSGYATKYLYRKCRLP